MSRDDDNTQIRIIRSVAQDEIRDERNFYLAEMRKALKDIKTEMRDYFATKTDLANWKLDLTEHNNRHTREVLKEHSAKYHRPISLVPKPAFSKKSIGIISGIVSIIAGIVIAVVKLID